MDINFISGQVVDSALCVHRHLGPGLLESAYEACLAYELRERGLSVIRQRGLPIVYKEVQLDEGYRLDLLVENQVIVEIKAVERFAPIHYAQLISYLKLSSRRVGLLINFHEVLLKNGIRRMVNHY